MWSDNESEVDLLGFDHLVTVITSIIRNESLLPATIGVYGDWGSGKSSLLKRTQAVLETDKDVLVLSFNGWLFEGYEDAKTALMGTILDEIASKRTLVPAAKHLIVKLFKRINVMEVVTRTGKMGLKGTLAYAVGGLPALGLSGASDIATLASELGDKVKEVKLEDAELDKFLKEDASQNLRRGIREFRKDFEKLLKETKLKTLVVIIDDLDRCMPDTIIETLEAIKLFLFVPHTAFILGADERLVKYAVRRRFPELPGERAEVGRDYLEKLVQFAVRVPSLGRSELETYINLLFFAKTTSPTSDAFKKAQEYITSSSAGSFLDVRFNYGIAKSILNDEIPPELAEDLNIAQRIAPVLAVGLNGNPRQCKRFLNTLMMRLEMAKAKKVEMKQRVLAKLMLLEYFKPEFFKRLAELQAAQQGQPKELAIAEQNNAPKNSTNTTTSNGQTGDDKDETETSDKSKIASKGKATSDDIKKSSSAKPNPSPLSSEASTSSISTWLSDSWFTDWLKSNPLLADEDLRPYFFFSRDILQGSLGGALQRMTPQAQEMLKELFQESEAARNIALKKAKEMSPGDASAVFQAISERVREEEDLGDEKSALNRLNDLVAARPELFSQFIALLNGIPDGNLPIAIVLKIATLAKENGEINPTLELLSKWSTSATSAPFKTAAKNAIERLKNS